MDAAVFCLICNSVTKRLAILTFFMSVFANILVSTNQKKFHMLLRLLRLGLSFDVRLQLIPSPHFQYISITSMRNKCYNEVWIRMTFFSPIGGGGRGKRTSLTSLTL